ncbi:unnamed protein product [Leptosia nina]|uniref:Cathepsin propeptide inhibitor domain-containing protein n=1 Tax=Leptosia nina TaxID=320188 RepID=A0AAV1JCR6_9NEOP
MIRLVCCLGVVLGAWALENEKPYYNLENAGELFENFRIKYNRIYDDEMDREIHFQAFVNTLKRINEQNVSASSTVYDINKFADYTSEELEDLTGFLIKKSNATKSWELVNRSCPSPLVLRGVRRQLPLAEPRSGEADLNDKTQIPYRNQIIVLQTKLKSVLRYATPVLRKDNLLITNLSSAVELCELEQDARRPHWCGAHKLDGFLLAGNLRTNLSPTKQSRPVVSYPEGDKCPGLEMAHEIIDKECH